MQGLRFTLRQALIAIAVIGVLITYWNSEPMLSALLVAIPVAIGFVIASWVCRRIEQISQYSMRSPRILLILILAGIGLASLAITILIRRSLGPDSPVLLIVVFSIPTLLGFVIYQVSQGSLRFRLTFEILTLVVLLTLSTWTWRPQHLIQAIERADALAAQIAKWADGSNTSKKRKVLRRESAWFRHRAFALRRQAFWHSFIHGRSGYHYSYEIYDTERLVLELGNLEAIDTHEMRARQVYEGQDTQHGP